MVQECIRELELVLRLVMGLAQQEALDVVLALAKVWEQASEHVLMEEVESKSGEMETEVEGPEVGKMEGGQEGLYRLARMMIRCFALLHVLH